MKVPIIEDKEGNATWSLLIEDISSSDIGVDLNWIAVKGYRGKVEVFHLEVKASGKTQVTLNEEGGIWAYCSDKDDYTSFIMAMSIAREYAVEQLHKAMKDEASK
jgi:hypothetical protein